MVDIRYSYDSVPTIKRFSESTKRIRGLLGPFGSGKSSGCIIEAVKVAAAQHLVNGKRRSRIVCIRNTYRQLEDTTMKTLYEWLPPQHFGTAYVDDHRYVATRLAPDLEIEFLFRALDRPEHVANLLSAEYTMAWVNEAREVPWSVIQALAGRVGRFPPQKDGGAVRAGMIMDSNPPDTDSWWYKLFEERKPDNVELFRQPSGRSAAAENLANLEPGYYANLMATMDADQIRCYVDGEYGWIKDGKAVYTDYSDSLHCAEVEPLPNVEVIRGWDFGLTPACVWTQQLPDGRFLVFDELCGDDVDIHQFGQAVTDHHAQRGYCKQVVDIGDPSGMARSATSRTTEARSCFQILHGQGIKIIPGEQTLTIRLGSIKRALQLMRGGSPVFVLHPRCTMLRKGFQGRYQYRRIKISGAQERYEDTPDKNMYSHPHDALQYIGGRVFGGVLRARDAKPPILMQPSRIYDAEMNY